MLSRRANWNAPTNRLAEARARRVRDRREILDLTISNPTAAGIAYPLDELREALARGARAAYAPEPFGLGSAREAIASAIGCQADDVVLTASTSEAYSYLFKLLTDPGDEILTATPAYPLLEHLTALELVRPRTFPLEWHGRWHLHAARAREAVTSRTRAIVVVNPNNPTGSYVRSREQDDLATLGLPVISDEVFFDYPLGEESAKSLSRSDILTFTLGGLSKSAGLPHYKLAWIRVNGPVEECRRAMRGLELIADSFLSVATPVQVALPDLLRLAPAIRQSIGDRCRSNLALVDAEIGGSVARLPVEAGWSVILRIPSLEPEEDFALRLLDENGVVIHPGYFFDFDRDGFLVVSLLTQPDVLREGLRRIVDGIAA